MKHKRPRANIPRDQAPRIALDARRIAASEAEYRRWEAAQFRELQSIRQDMHAALDRAQWGAEPVGSAWRARAMSRGTVLMRMVLDLLQLNQGLAAMMGEAELEAVGLPFDVGRREAASEMLTKASADVADTAAAVDRALGEGEA